MNSKKSYLLVIALAVLGAVAFSKIAVSPAITFVIGVFTCALILSLSTPASSSKKEQDDKPATTTLYVGNLPYKANESHVRQLFSEYGQVFAVRLMKDKRTGKRRGFGFVVVASNDTKNIISSLNEKDYMERTLKVRVANDPKHPESEESES
ncbi:RNA recognition motif domain-containing protein [Vibrio tapetis]|uniref:Putative RNA-binding protein n=1 Tax=Vibrio tapetis subsp. tapetis TaxID=1671868 RepID=A0A2N8ZHL2_9VIBR|nr:RNA-binding protein [Vibrio tapetis]SON51389.1 putative RNA-binding protein [Vibrio tapetis subsp. tapetis]